MGKMKWIAVSFTQPLKYNKDISFFFFSACTSPDVRCNDGQCIKFAQVCDSTEDCPDGEDEAGCRKHESDRQENIFDMHTMFPSNSM